MKLKYLLLAIAGLSMFTSCETDEPSLIVAQYQKPTTFVLNTPQFANGVYDLQNAGALNLTFSQPDYGYSAVCKYTIELSKTEDFATPVAMSTTYSVCDIDIDANDFAMSVCTAFGWESQSDVDAALHYLARLIEAEDLDSIYRRLSVICYEDIGLANPSMGPKVDAAIHAAERTGLPEARIPLGTIVVEMALSPKSNSGHLALDLALQDIRNGNTGNLPEHLRTNSKTYKYPHDYPNAWVKQQYLPDKLVGRKYYQPKTTSKYEQSLKQIYDKLNELEKR